MATTENVVPNMSITEDEPVTLSMEIERDSSRDTVTAEKWAVGQANGVDVSSSDVTHNNNSKYHSEVAAQKSEDAEAWANGTRGGTAVGTTDAAYQKSSKYFSELAQAAANTAAAKLTEMIEKITQAQGYASAAQVAQAAAEAAMQTVLESIISAQGYDMLRMDENGDFFVLEEDE